MSDQKDKIRGLIIGIIHPDVKYRVDTLPKLYELVAQGLHGKSSTYPRELTDTEWLIANEVVWDLVADRTITPGRNPANPDFPHFRVSKRGTKIN